MHRRILGANTLNCATNDRGHHDPTRQKRRGTVTQSVTIDPANNGGSAARSHVKGAAAARMDIEVRYAMARGESGIFCLRRSSPTRPPTPRWARAKAATSQAQPGLRLDLRRRRPQHAHAPRKTAGAASSSTPRSSRILSTGYYKNSVEHKYSYNAVQYKIPAYGWSSTKDHIGVYFINPTTEYLSGGARRWNWSAISTPTTTPTRSSSITGAATTPAARAATSPPAKTGTRSSARSSSIATPWPTPRIPSQADLDTLAATAGNPTVPPAWKDNATALWQDALDQAKMEKAQWPYDWVNGVDYPHKDQRGNVTGQLVLNDPQAATTKLPHLTVGLAHPDYTSNAGGFVQRSGNGNVVNWPHDGELLPVLERRRRGRQVHDHQRPPRHVHPARLCRRRAGRIRARPTSRSRRARTSIWARSSGSPSATASRSGRSATRTATAASSSRATAKLLALGLVRALRRTVPQRHHLHHRQERLPQGLVLRAGAARVVRCLEEPRRQGPAQPALRLGERPPARACGARSAGAGRPPGRSSSTWTRPPQGKATLRVALGGADGTAAWPWPSTASPSARIRPVSTNALRYNTDRGVWQEYAQPFDAALLKAGENQMQLTVPAGEVTTGVCYDYLRLELDGRRCLGEIGGGSVAGAIGRRWIRPVPPRLPRERCTRSS